VSRHQAEGVAAPVVAVDVCREQAQEEAALVLVQEDRGARDSSRGDVVDARGREQVPRLSHWADASGRRSERQGRSSHSVDKPSHPCHPCRDRFPPPRGDSPRQSASAGEPLDEAIHAARLGDVVDLERPGDERAVAEQPPRQALLQLQVLDRPASAPSPRAAAACRRRGRPCPSSRRDAFAPSARPPAGRPPPQPPSAPPREPAAATARRAARRRSAPARQPAQAAARARRRVGARRSTPLRRA